MKYFYVIVNQDKPYARETARHVQEHLEVRGASCVVKMEKRRKASGRYTEVSDVPLEVECVITIGGDGTLIQAARDLAALEIPFIGINRGHLGYLTQVSREEDIGNMLDALLSDNYQIEERMMLEGQIIQGEEIQFEDIALNEILLTRTGTPRVLHFRISVNGEFLNEYTADGIIIATPTGSTAYNLSAGGPIVVPHSQMMVMTPICSHALNTRSIVFPAQAQLQIDIMGTEQCVAFDGDMVRQLEDGNRIIIEKADCVTRLIKLDRVSFLENIRNKMTGI
ncbi:NAD(+)/NADH kinase [Clostridium sp. AM58-1XD]|uniref:NAD(+)/NADH kinase n=1 Tax=Clostridium sp. AM58-1XD TaxID=2292307 RepID=UPI000E511A2A|nr:NAD(+)/NADH kinase [Clostridium sp. AM58-1XD]RGZ00931.1 NAD(+)/NADH kinase [Clostridium sp. AM58-1XD]